MPGTDRLRSAVVIVVLATACARGSGATFRTLPDPNATIVGRVIDNYHHRPLADAIVDVEQTDATARTDSSGNFRIDAIPPGRRVLRTRHMGFYPGRGQILLRPGSTYRIEMGIGAVMTCLDECEDYKPEPTPSVVHVVEVTPSKRFIDAMSIIWCDSTPMKPVGRMVQIPGVSAPAFGLGALVGSVSEAETGDALGHSVVVLLPTAGGKGQSKKERPTDPLGGFAFDSIVPGEYELRVRYIGHNAQDRRIRISANRVEIIRVMLRTYRCSGY